MVTAAAVTAALTEAVAEAVVVVTLSTQLKMHVKFLKGFHFEILLKRGIAVNLMENYKNFKWFLRRHNNQSF